MKKIQAYVVTGKTSLVPRKFYGSGQWCFTSIDEARKHRDTAQKVARAYDEYVVRRVLVEVMKDIEIAKGALSACKITEPHCPAWEITEPHYRDIRDIHGNGFVEAICPHGIGHHRGVHECDGCCDLPEAKEWMSKTTKE